MLVGNLIANFIGNMATDLLFSFHETKISEDLISRLKDIDLIYVCFSIPTCICFILLYERPLRRCLKMVLNGQSPNPELMEKAQRRLLNEPYFIVTLNACLWGLGSAVFWAAGSPGGPYLGIACGLITVILSFFWVEHVSQHNLIKYFFPKGGLSSVKGAKRIRLSTRLVSLLIAGTFIPLFFIHGTIVKTLNQSVTENPALGIVLLHLKRSIDIQSLIFAGLAICITFFVLQNLKKPVKEIIRVLNHIRNGKLDERADIYSNDEIGFTGDVVNAMADELQEKEKMSRSLDLAKKVQQSLLPKQDLCTEWFDIVGTSIYCDQTGGDYYDIFTAKNKDESFASVVISDVSGHGISSALLMASARSSLRLRKSQPGTMGDIISDVNRQICEDFSDSGQFISMFFMAVYPVQKRLEWIRAGHDPGLVYDPQTDRFTELKGPGIVLGIDDTYPFQSQHLDTIKPGQIIVLFTDGIWEARNPEGQLFGKKNLKKTIRDHSDKDAGRIVERILEALSVFQGMQEREDDMTLIIVKIKKV
jgi:sigma-B regulation protein RsbU (phosphoserine phosphatase)